MNHARIQRWVSEHAPKFDPAVIPIEDSASIWEKPQYHSVDESSGGDSKSLEASDKEMDLEALDTKEEGSDVLDGDKSRSGPPIFGATDENEKPHLDRLFHDSISIYEQDTGYRKRIDTFARDLRSGHYCSHYNVLILREKKGRGPSRESRQEKDSVLISLLLISLSLSKRGSLHIV